MRKQGAGAACGGSGCLILRLIGLDRAACEVDLGGRGIGESQEFLKSVRCRV